MAILWVKERPGLTSSANREFTRTYSRRFLVKSDRPDESEIAIYRHASIPKPWQPHPRDNGAFVDEVVPEQQKNKYLWDVGVDYTSDVEEPEERQNPLSRPAKIRYRSRSRQEIVTEDEDDKPVLNTAGDYFDPPLQDEATQWVIEVEKNLPAVPRWLPEFDNKINNGTVVIEGISYPKHTLRMKGLQIGEKQQKRRVKYRQVRFELHYDSRTHLLRPLNRGYRELVEVETGFAGLETETKLQEIRVDGEIPADPQFLDEDGKHIAKPTRENIVIREIIPKSMKPKPFSRLPLR